MTYNLLAHLEMIGAELDKGNSVRCLNVAGAIEASIKEIINLRNQLAAEEASHEGLEKQAQNEAYEIAAVVCEAVCEALVDVPCGLGGKEIAIVIRAMKETK